MSKRKDKIRGEVGTFLKQYQRKAQSGIEPNDRGYSREIENKIKSMSPEELSEIMTGDGEDLSTEEDHAWLSGECPSGVLYTLNQAVQLETTECGTVISLLQVRPEPKYIVLLVEGTEIEVFQSKLSAIST